MSVTLELEPELETRVRYQAKSLGKSVERYLAEIIDETIVDESGDAAAFYETATDEEWIAELDSLADLSEKIPVSWDDSRESIYGQREDAQL